jgi:hypothetical protein
MNDHHDFHHTRAMGVPGADGRQWEEQESNYDDRQTRFGDKDKMGLVVVNEKDHCICSGICMRL